jgi:hypothetical protein
MWHMIRTCKWVARMEVVRVVWTNYTLFKDRLIKWVPEKEKSESRQATEQIKARRRAATKGRKQE